MKDKLIILFGIGAVALLTMANVEDSSSINKRYIFYPSQEHRDGLNMNYLVDSKTGKVWVQAFMKDANYFDAVAYKSINGKFSLMPPDDGNELIKK